MSAPGLLALVLAGLIGNGVATSGSRYASVRLVLSMNLETAQLVTIESTGIGDAAVVRVDAIRTGHDALHERRSYFVDGHGELAIALVDTITAEGSEGLAVRELGAAGDRMVQR